MSSTDILTATPTPTMAPTSALGQSASQSAAVSSASQAMHSLSSAIASASAALSSESAIASGGGMSLPSWMKWLGLIAAVSSGFLIGSSFVFKKKGLLAAQKKYEVQAGESMAYLKSPMWWIGMSMMIVGEILNVLAYAVTSAVLVTPLGALSVVICAILSSIFLKESLTLFGKVGCFLCIVGSVIIALNAPSQHAAGQIKVFEKMFVSVGFLVWTGLCIATSLGLYFFAVPRWGKKNMLVHITICSLIGGLSVSTISGLGGAIVLSIQGDNQFKHWFVYFLLGFVAITLVIEIIFLNKALELFNTAMVTPTYYVLFTFASLVTSIILFQGLDASPVQIVTIVMGFLTICAGICLLQLSKIDPKDLTEKDGVGIDRSTTLLMRASRSQISIEEGKASGVEDPGVDTIRGGLGIIGSIVRARSSRRVHASADAYCRMADEHHHGGAQPLNTLGKHDLERYELHDRPMPLSPSLLPHQGHLTLPNRPFGMPQKRDTTISFASGSDEPHGHRASSTPRGSGGSTSANAGAAGANSIHHVGILVKSPEAKPGGAKLYSAEPLDYSDEYSREELTIRPVGPRIPRSNNADDLRAIWNVPVGADSTSSLQSSSSKAADLSQDDLDDKDGSDPDDSGASSPTLSKRAGRSFPLSRRSQSKDDQNRREEEELLTPVMRNQKEFGGKRR